MKLEITKPARQDLVLIYKYIALDSYPKYADQALDNIYRHLDMLLAMPELGSLRPEIGDNIRLYPSGKINVIYQVAGDTVYILRAHHSALDPTSLSF